MIVSPEDYAKSYNATAHFEEVEKYNSLYKAHFDESHYFLNASNHNSLGDWLLSKGTSYPCYIQYIMQNREIDDINNKIDVIRTVIYAISKPLQSQFFYWTLLLLILHKFNFRKPVMKVILAHYVLRVIGDILEQLGVGLMKHYFSVDKSGGCVTGDVSAEYHPLRWFLTRLIGNFFWYGGEIAGDWYPLLRTRAVAREQRSIWFVYVTCALFNISKVVVIGIHFLQLPTRLYKPEGVFDEDAKDHFYNIYWACQSAVLFCSFFYDLTVYLVLKRQIFNKSKAEFGFLKKFRSISEYRMAISAFIGIIGLPVVIVTLIVKFYFIGVDNERYSQLNFSFEDIRLLISNVQYYMIFIDQILLFRSRDGSSLGETTSVNTSPYNSNFSSNNVSGNNNVIKPYNIDSKLYYSNLNSLNSNTLVNSQTTLMQYSGNGSGRLKPTSNDIIRNNSHDRYNGNFNRNNSIGTYDDYNGVGNEWNYLRR
eukprot:jgi/Orpsp1_1/1178407/evm.model.c7180000065153.1